jgi:hypothetical protein
MKNDILAALEMASLEFDANYGTMVSKLKDVVACAAKISGTDTEKIPAAIDFLIRKSIEAGYMAGYDASSKLLEPAIKQLLQGRCNTMRMVREAISVTDNNTSRDQLISLIDEIIQDYELVRDGADDLFAKKGKKE